MDYFDDTSAFYASKDPSDKNYQRAKTFMEHIKNDISSSLITSNFVIDESITLIRMKLGHEAALKFGDLIHKSDIVEVVRVSEVFEKRAWRFLQNTPTRILATRTVRALQ